MDMDIVFVVLPLYISTVAIKSNNQDEIEVWTSSFKSVGLKLFSNYSSLYTVPIYRGLEVRNHLQLRLVCGSFCIHLVLSSARENHGLWGWDQVTGLGSFCSMLWVIISLHCDWLRESGALHSYSSTRASIKRHNISKYHSSDSTGNHTASTMFTDNLVCWNSPYFFLKIILFILVYLSKFFFSRTLQAHVDVLCRSIIWPSNSWV